MEFCSDDFTETVDLWDLKDSHHQKEPIEPQSLKLILRVWHDCNTKLLAFRHTNSRNNSQHWGISCSWPHKTLIALYNVPSDLSAVVVKLRLAGGMLGQRLWMSESLTHHLLWEETLTDELGGGQLKVNTIMQKSSVTLELQSQVNPSSSYWAVFMDGGNSVCRFQLIVLLWN